MRSSIPTKYVEPFGFGIKRMSQSLLNEVKYSNIHKCIKHLCIKKWYVAIPFKWGQVFQLKYSGGKMEDIERESQSLLNEVKYSNTELSDNIKKLNETVAIPFKWGQVFQLLKRRLPEGVILTSSQSLLNEVKYSNGVKDEWSRWSRKRSQSLLNEVKYSNEEKMILKKGDNNCRNPF